VEACWRCGSTSVRPRGFQRWNGKVKRRYDCKSCNHQFTLPVERYRLAPISSCRICHTRLNESNWYPALMSNKRYICISCYKKYQKSWNERTDHNRRYAWKERVQAIQHYGGRCACCGESELRFLVLDHVDEDGALQRKQMRGAGGWRFYRWLRLNQYPDSFTLQILCANCNMAKTFFGGCPHGKTNPQSNSRSET
jgi:hypothetical protein